MHVRLMRGTYRKGGQFYKPDDTLELSEIELRNANPGRFEILDPQPEPKEQATEEAPEKE